MTDGMARKFSDHHDDCDDDYEAFDDVKGTRLDPGLVRDARQKELKILKQRGVYRYASTKEAMRRTNRKPLRLKWVDTNKGGSDSPFIRSRLVATEVRKPGVDPIFAPAPPPDSLRLLLSRAAS